MPTSSLNLRYNENQYPIVQHKKNDKDIQYSWLSIDSTVKLVWKLLVLFQGSTESPVNQADKGKKTKRKNPYPRKVAPRNQDNTQDENDAPESIRKVKQSKTDIVPKVVWTIIIFNRDIYYKFIFDISEADELTYSSIII